MGFDNTDMYRFMNMYIDCLMINCELLNRLDSNLSNRNHGSNLLNGVKCLSTLFPNFKSEDLSTQFSDLSFLYSYKVKGATAPIYSYAFKKISEYVNDRDCIDVDMFYDILVIFENAVRNVGNCKLNDKTMLDCIVPVVMCCERYKDFPTIKLLKNLSIECKLACENTANMSSKKGKARHNASYSMGVIDPGAYSLFLFFDTLFKYFLKRKRCK